MIVVTGGSGKAGRACISELVAHGYELCNVDLVSGSDPSIPFCQVDLTDFGQTMAALSGIDERVHKVTGIVHHRDTENTEGKIHRFRRLRRFFSEDMRRDVTKHGHHFTRDFP